MEEKTVGTGIPEYKPKAITHEELQHEYAFLRAQRFAKRLLAEGKITECEFNKIMQKIRDKFSPLYPEIRA